MLEAVHSLLTWGFRLTRRVDPFFRPLLAPLLEGPLSRLVQASLNWSRSRGVPPLGAEQKLEGEDQLTARIIARMQAHLAQDFAPGGFERAGQTKTYGIVAAELEILAVPEALRQGIFASVRRYPAWVRFSNPGPHLDADIDDVGVASLGLKLMDVHGPKLLEEEQATQDFTALSTPMFVSRDLKANVALQYWSKRHLGLFYFLDPRASHVRELIMQGLWSRTLGNPLGTAFYSCVPYRLGPDIAVQYAFRPLTRVDRRVSRLPFRPGDNYLADAMERTLGQTHVSFEMTVQVQTDSFRMPIEDAAIIWPERLSPRVPVARLHIPKQAFRTAQRHDLDRALRINPWHSLEAHRPLGNQNRGRLHIYRELADCRQTANQVRHREPDADDLEYRSVFPGEAARRSAPPASA